MLDRLIPRMITHYRTRTQRNPGLPRRHQEARHHLAMQSGAGEDYAGSWPPHSIQMLAEWFGDPEPSTIPTPIARPLRNWHVFCCLLG